MPKHSKRYAAATNLVDKNKLYSTDEVVDILKKVTTAKFDETLEMHITTNIDPKKPEQQIRTTITLPAGTGRTVRIIVFAKGDKAEEAKKAGADIVGAEDLVQKILSEGFMDFDIAIATPDMMRVIGKLGRVLGPRGLMPNPKSGTVTQDISNAVAEFKKGKVEVRNDKTGNLHVTIGKASFDKEKIKENIVSTMNQINVLRPAGIKGAFIRKVIVTSTMGPGIKLDMTSL